jgi:nickel/cobalt exporter
MLSTVLSVGIIPCAGTIIILLFSLAMDIFWVGILMAGFIALGMAVTISLSGITAISAKKGLFKFLPKDSKALITFNSLIQLFGSVLIICLGAFLFFGSL